MKQCDNNKDDFGDIICNECEYLKGKDLSCSHPDCFEWKPTTFDELTGNRHRESVRLWDTYIFNRYGKCTRFRQKGPKELEKSFMVKLKEKLWGK